MNFKSLTALALAALVLAPLTPAQAADYDPPIYVEQAPEYEPVEVGSGWYLRGDVSYLAQKSYQDQDFTFTPASFSEKQDPAFASIGFGYHFNDYLRADINLGYLPGNNGRHRLRRSRDRRYRRPRQPCASASLQNYSAVGVMANGYVDLGTYVGITPYLGAGIGLVRSKYKLSASYFTDNARPYGLISSAATTRPSMRFAYTLDAGLAYQVTKNFRRSRLQYFSAPDAEYVTAATPDLLSGPQGHQQSSGQARPALRTLVGWLRTSKPDGGSLRSAVFVCAHDILIADCQYPVSDKNFPLDAGGLERISPSVGHPSPTRGLLSGRIDHDDDASPSRTCVRQIPISPPAPAPSAPAGRSKR